MNDFFDMVNAVFAFFHAWLPTCLVVIGVTVILLIVQTNFHNRTRAREREALKRAKRMEMTDD